VDHKVDREKLLASPPDKSQAYLDAAFARHPIAQGLLPLREAVLWAAGWGCVALVCAAALNPVSAYILLLGCLLEVAYCKLLTVTSLRALISGVVKTLGGLAAVYAVAPSPSPWFVAGLFAWIFLWEIGGQNIPADWYDVGEDTCYEARTIPLCYGPRTASRVAAGSIAAGLAVSALVLGLAPGGLAAPFLLAALAAGVCLTLLPVLHLMRNPFDAADKASRLFNLSSYYPAATLAVLLAQMMVERMG
jgi:4-hydroxybenzoate polyprenyltransferase